MVSSPGPRHALYHPAACVESRKKCPTSVSQETFNKILQLCFPVYLCAPPLPLSLRRAAPTPSHRPAPAARVLGTLSLQRMGSDPAGGDANPQAEGDADTVAGEAAVQVAPVPERGRGRGRGTGRLPHGPALSPVSPVGWDSPREARAPLRPGGAGPFAESRPRWQPWLRALTVEAPGKSFRNRAAPQALPLLSGVGGVEAAPQWQEPGAASPHKGCAPAS